ncbi:MAG: sensor histidine kinase [Hydrogenovibrio sp.]
MDKAQEKAIEQKRLAELEAAFELFNQTSSQLTLAYESLQNQVEDLQAKLDESNREKHRVGERLEQLLNLLPAGVIVLDEYDAIIDMNPAAELILGADAMGRNWEVVVRNVFLMANDAGELMTHNQMVYQLSQSPLSLSKEDGERLNGKILLIQDVTAARDLQQHISRHQRLSSMGEMAASLAHQIRTPLASALLYVSQLSSPQLAEDKRDKFVDKSLTSLRHLEALVKDMLQYAKGGKAKDQKVTISGLLEALKHSVEPKVNQSNSEIRFHEKSPGLVVLGDEDALLTALENLVGNAIDIVSQQAKIDVFVLEEPQRNRVDIIVADHGPGLSEEMNEKIFEPFFTSRAQGTGLGLAVVRAVAEAHGGEAWVKSIKGQGARFGLRLPLLQNGEVT